MRLMTTMIISLLFLLGLVVGGDAYVLARRAEQRIQDRATYQGGFTLNNPASCPANYSTACGSTTDVNQQCCPQGNTCFGGSVGYCCPTSQDCQTYVNTFPACADSTANMFTSEFGYFCCVQGLTAVIPSSGFPFCETADVSVAVSLLATMVIQYGATATGGATNTGTGIVTATGGSQPNPISSGISPTSTPISGTNSIIKNFSNAAFIGLIVGGIILLCIACSIWRCLKKRVKTSIENMDWSHSAGPSMVPAYIPTNVPIYEPGPIQSYNLDVYDPVHERQTLVYSRSPTPMTPSPAYTTVDYEAEERTRMYDPLDTDETGTARS